jgi:hypothetical protein
MRRIAILSWQACCTVIGLSASVVLAADPTKCGLVACPSDTVVFTGGEVHLQCASTPGHNLRWYRDKQTVIYSGGELYEDDGHYDVTNDSYIAGSVDLLIKDARLSHAGLYTCKDMTDNIDSTAIVFIFDSKHEYAYSINMSGRNAVRQHCKFTYSCGPACEQPTIEWFDVDGHVVSDISRNDTVRNASQHVVIESTFVSEAVVKCRLIPPRPGSGPPALGPFSEPEYIVNVRAVTQNAATEDAQIDLHTRSAPLFDALTMNVYAITVTGLAVLMTCCTVVLCLMKARRPRVKSCKHFGLVKANMAQQGSLLDQTGLLKSYTSSATTPTGDLHEIARHDNSGQTTDGEYAHLNLCLYQSLIRGVSESARTTTSDTMCV